MNQHSLYARQLSVQWQVMKLRQFRFRALITLDPAGPRSSPLHPPAQQYPNHTHALVVLAHPLHGADRCRYFPAETCWDGGEPLHPGDHAVVTLTVNDDEAGEFLGTGQQFVLWSGGDVGHGVVSRRVFSEGGPC
jgi:hypothetical protein